MDTPDAKVRETKSLKRRLWKWGWAAADFGIPVGMGTAGLVAYNPEWFSLGAGDDWAIIAVFFAAVPLCAGIGVLAAFVTYQE